MTDRQMRGRDERQTDTEVGDRDKRQADRWEIGTRDRQTDGR